MSWGMLLVGLGVPPKSQQGLCPFQPLPSPGAGNGVVGGNGGARDATAPAGLQGTGEGEQLRTDKAEPPGLTGLGMAVNKMEIYFKGGEKTLLTFHHSHPLVGKIRMV